MRIVTEFPRIPMGQFGENPYGKPLYRIVFSDSRTDLIGGKWPDGACEYREVHRYPGIRGQWIMEKWVSAKDYAGTPEQYQKEQWDSEARLLTTGPYPNRGEYTYCHTFIVEPTDTTVRWAVYNNKISRDLTAGQRREGIMAPLEQQAKDQDNRFSDIWDDTLGGFQNSDTVVSFAPGTRAGFKRASDMPMERFDQASPLPTRDGYFGTGGEQLASRIKGDQ